MNGRFAALPEEKQQQILNAGFKVFSENSYKKSPVQEIADAAGISKSLLFYYFRNKKELYLFLWEQAAGLTMKYLTEYRCYEPSDLFEMMRRGMRAKIQIMRNYPPMAAFVVKAFYETDPAVCQDVHRSYRGLMQKKADQALQRLDPRDFAPGLNLQMMYREMYLTSEGYLWEIMQRGDTLDAEALEKDFSAMLDFWKSVYGRKE